MLPFDQRPWAKTAAMIVIGVTLLAAVAYIVIVRQTRPLDWGERAIIFFLLLTIIPPNVAVIRRHNPAGA